MDTLSLALVAAGVALVAVGVARGRAPWARYRSLQEQDANVARYEAWRGGLRDDAPTGASVAMAVLRRQIRDAALVAGLGVVLSIIGISSGA